MSYGIGRTPGHRVIVWTSLLALLLAAAPLTAQERRRLTAEDYARAERFLPANTVPLVTNVASQPTWLPDGRFWYRSRTEAGLEYVLVAPARGRRGPAFDHAPRASPVAPAQRGRVDRTPVPIHAL